MQECLKAYYFSNPQTIFLINRYLIPIPLQNPISENEILKTIKKITKNIEIVPAVEICQKELGTNVVAGIYLLSLASFKNLIPLQPKSILKAIKKIIPEKYLELNEKAFNLAKS